jgi:hypothetical protein
MAISDKSTLELGRAEPVRVKRTSSTDTTTLRDKNTGVEEAGDPAPFDIGPTTLLAQNGAKLGVYFVQVNLFKVTNADGTVTGTMSGPVALTSSGWATTAGGKGGLRLLIQLVNAGGGIFYSYDLPEYSIACGDDAKQYFYQQPIDPSYVDITAEVGVLSHGGVVWFKC